MQANPRTLDELFNSQLRYVVPMFQRIYVWQENPQWQTLWEDVAEKADLQLRKEPSNAHYLGALIIEGVKPSSPREVKRFLVIDGQQRLTTLQVLFCAYRDFARRKAWTTLDRTTSRYLENADVDVMENPSEERFKLWPTTLNRSYFSDIVSAGSVETVEQRHPIVRLKYKRKNEPRNALVDAYVFFHRKISNWVGSAAATRAISEEECAFALLQALQQDFAVVEIALSDGDDSQEIFYSLNSQGRPLSQSDLLRSLIFMRAEKEKKNKEEIFDRYWGRYESPFWSAEVKRGGRSYSRLDLGLRFFLMAKTGKMVDARRVNEEYRRWITGPPPQYASIHDELSDFSRHTQAYERYETIERDVPSTDLRRVLRDFDVSTALPLLLFLELDAGLSSQQFIAAAETIESFIARRILCGAETREYNIFFVEIVGTLRGIASDAIQASLEEKLLAGGGTTRSWPTDQEIIESAISRQMFTNVQTPALRLILERIELALRGKKSEDRSIPEGLQIEHVLPQTWATHWPLQGKVIPALIALYPSQVTEELAPLADAIRSRNARLHTLGNLTLLNRYLNPAASNGSFDLKRAEYSNSVLRCNRYFDGLMDWNEDAILKRGKGLGELLCRIWPRPSGP
jgi:hypothetical protein